MAIGRRIPYQIPMLAGRQWEDAAPELYHFLQRVWDSETDGLPPGASQAIPQFVEAGTAGSAGAETDGWASGTHAHPVSTGIPVGLGFEAEEGTGGDLARALHVHPYLDLYEDLVVSYRFEEGSGDRYPSIGSYILTENAGPVSSNTGQIGDAVEFSGANNLYIDNALALQQGSFDYSVCLWAYLDTVAGIQYVIAKDGGTGDREYGITYDPAGAGGAGSFQAFLQSTVPTVFAVECTDIVPVVDTWYFLHYWYDHSESTIYLRVNDGDTFSTSCAGETPYTTAVRRFAVGTRRDGSPTNFWDGRVDALHWHQRLLSEGEHDILYAGGDGRELWVPMTLSNSILTPGGTAKSTTGVVVSDAVVWEAPYNATVTAVRATRKGGTGATINMRKNYTSEHLAGDLSLPAATTTYDGGAVQNESYAAGDIMEARIKSVAGSPTEIAIWARVERT